MSAEFAVFLLGVLVVVFCVLTNIHIDYCTDRIVEAIGKLKEERK